MPTVQHAENLDGIAATTMGNDIGSSPDNQLASPFPATRPAAIWKTDETADGCKDVLDLLRCGGWLVAINVSAQCPKIR